MSERKDNRKGQGNLTEPGKGRETGFRRRGGKGRSRKCDRGEGALLGTDTGILKRKSGRQVRTKDHEGRGGTKRGGWSENEDSPQCS